MFISGVCPPYY